MNLSLYEHRKSKNKMAKKEVKTDLCVARQLDESKIKYDAQSSDVNFLYSLQEDAS